MDGVEAAAMTSTHSIMARPATGTPAVRIDTDTNPMLVQLADWPIEARIKSQLTESLR